MDTHSIAATAGEQVEWSRGGIRRDHGQGIWELEELERELPGAPLESGKEVAATGRGTPGLGFDCYGGGGSGTLSN